MPLSQKAHSQLSIIVAHYQYLYISLIYYIYQTRLPYLYIVAVFMKCRTRLLHFGPFARLLTYTSLMHLCLRKLPCPTKNAHTPHMSTALQLCFICLTTTRSIIYRTASWVNWIFFYSVMGQLQVGLSYRELYLKNRLFLGKNAVWLGARPIFGKMARYKNFLKNAPDLYLHVGSPDFPNLTGSSGVTCSLLSGSSIDHPTSDNS